MSIASEISRLQSAKANIKTSIENKGVSVATSATLDTYSNYIDAISIPSIESNKTVTLSQGTTVITPSVKEVTTIANSNASLSSVLTIPVGSFSSPLVSGKSYDFSGGLRIYDQQGRSWSTPRTDYSDSFVFDGTSHTVPIGIDTDSGNVTITLIEFVITASGAVSIRLNVSSNRTTESVYWYDVTLSSGEDYDAMAQVTATVSGPTYTCTITSSNITSDQDFYIQYNGITYKTEGDTFTFTPGDTLTCKVITESGSCYVRVNGNEVSVGNTNTTYNYRLPNGNVDISLYYASVHSACEITPKVTSTCILSSSGNVNTAYVVYNNTKYYQRGHTFEYTPGDNLYFYVECTGTKAYIEINEVEVISDNSVCEYNLILPQENIVIHFSTGSTAYASISMPIAPTGAFTLTRYDSYYDVTSYAKARASTPEGRLFYNRTLSVSMYQEWLNELSIFSQMAFAGTTLQVVDPCQINFNNLKEIPSSAFFNVTLNRPTGSPMATVNFPSTSIVYSGAFTDAFKNASINLPSCTTLRDYAFAQTGVSYVNLPELLTIPQYCFASTARVLRSVYAPKCTSIDTRAFLGCLDLEVADFSSCISVAPYAFASAGISYISMPSCTTTESYAFYMTTSLTSVYLPKIQSIGSYAFYGATLMENCDFGSSISFIGESAFVNCYKLTGLSLPNCSRINAYAFNKCQLLSTINGPSVTSIGSCAFSACSNLSYASFPMVTSISNTTFFSCSQLQTVYLPSVTLISNGAFSACAALPYISLPKCESIGTYGFAKCHNLSTVVLPNCTTLSSWVFQSCFHLLSLYLLGSTIIPFSANLFTSTPISTYTTSTGGVRGSIYVRASLYNAWSTATSWIAYSQRFVSMTDAQIEAFLT